jgi:hypothetical protein
MPLVPALVVTAILLRAGVDDAKITLDGSLRRGAPSGSLTGPRFVIPAEDGEVRGNNLYHSFGRFSVRTPRVLEIPTFTMKSH